MSRIQVSLDVATRLLHPRPVVIVVSRGRGGEVNGCAVSWITPVNRRPPIVAFSLSPKRYTYKLVRESGEVTVNIIGFEDASKTHYVGTKSGREVKDKLLKAGFKLKPSKKVSAPSIENALATLECIVEGSFEFPDHDLFVCKVVYAEAISGLLVEEVLSEEYKILLHVGSNIYTTTSRYVRV